MEQPEIQTDVFRVGAGVHARQALMRWAARFWYALALPIGILLLLGCFYDSRILFIAAAVIFILFPSLLFIGWHSVMTRPCAVRAVFPQQVTVSPDREIDVEYFPLPDIENSNPPAPVEILPGQVSGCRVMGDNVVITYDDNQDLIIPFKAFRKPSDIGLMLQRFEGLAELPE